MYTQESFTKRQMVLDLAVKYGYNEKHASLVEAASLMIFDALEKLHKMGCEERSLLSHASLLHDIGAHINSTKHNKHSKYLIENDERLNEYPKKEKELLALLVYNHTRKVNKGTLALEKKDRNIVLKLSSILSVADSLECTSEEVTIKNIEIKKSDMLLTLDGITPDEAVEKLTQKKDLFNDVFGLEIKFKQKPIKTETKPLPV